MKHKALLPFPFLGLLIAGLAAHVTARVYLSVSWLSDTFWLVHLVFPLILMGGAVAFHWTAKGRTVGYLLSYFLNAIGSGCLVGAIYGLRDYVPQMHLLGALIPALVIAAAAFLIPLFPNDLGKGITALVLRPWRLFWRLQVFSSGPFIPCP